MVIHTFEHEYPVTHVREIDGTSECYICRNESAGGLCRILAISDKSLFGGIIPGLADAAANSAFTDFIEHFIFDDMLCIVMGYTQGVSLKDRLETDSYALAEKLELGRRILERMILCELPDYYLTKCADATGIIVDSDMTLHFNYDIDDITSAHTYTREGAMEKVAELLRFFFAKEEENYTSAELSEFLGKLPQHIEAGDLVALYSAYHEMMQKATAADAKPAGEDSIWHKLWEKLKKLGGVLRRVLMVLLLIAAALYLIFTIGDAKNDGTRHTNFTKIGTVEIK